MGSIGRRLERLETLHSREPCGECGADGGTTTFEVVWTDAREHPEPQRCEECGRPREIVVTWDGLRGPWGDLPPDAA